jgi:lipopolysaccharide/colanic/teichoic acid biosynthesis glycosyltransferase
MSYSLQETPALLRPRVPPFVTSARLLDVVLAAAALLFLTPLIILVGAAIFVEGGRPIFFSQIRLGQGGRLFRLYKFRKFHERGPVGGNALTVENDPRLTRVGWFLERTKLDELPQFWNILRGELSVVGPRPETPNFKDCFADGYRAVLDHKPGLFGPAQAVFRNEGALHRGSDLEAFYRAVLFPGKARIDLAYYPTRTVMRDIGWIVACILAVLGWSRLPELGKSIVRELESRIRPNAPQQNALNSRPDSNRARLGGRLGPSGQKVLVTGVNGFRRHHRIMAQFVAINQILVAEGNPEHPPQHQGRHRVLDKIRRGVTGEAAGESLDHCAKRDQLPFDSHVTMDPII